VDAQTQTRSQGGFHLLGFVLAQEAVIDEYAYYPVSQDLREEGTYHRTVNAAGERAQHPPGAYLPADALRQLLQVVGGCPVGFASGDGEQEVGQYGAPVGRVLHFRVELGAEQRAV